MERRFSFISFILMGMTQQKELCELIVGKSDDERVEVSVALLRALVSENEQGEKLLTTQQVADALGVSRPYVVKLIDTGELAAERVGTHRRVRADDLEAYRDRRLQKSRAAMDELVALTEEMGLYQHQR